MRVAWLLGSLLGLGGCIDWSQLAPKDAGGNEDMARPACVSGQTPRTPRLVVATSDFVSQARIMIWDRADQLASSDRQADVRLEVPARVRALGLHQHRLFVATTSSQSPIWIYDCAEQITNGASVTATMPAQALGKTLSDSGPLSDPFEMHFDAAGSLWMVHSSGFDGYGVARFDDALKIDGSSRAAARFAPSRVSPSMAVDDIGQRLFVNSSFKSTTSIIVWDKATSASGDVTALPWTLSDVSTWKLALDKGADTLYAGLYEIFVWRNVSRAAQGEMPEVFAAGMMSGSVMDLSVQKGALVAVQGTSVKVWRNAGSLSSASVPDVTIPSPSHNIPARAVLGDGGRLYVADQNTVYVFNTNDTSDPPVPIATLSGMPVTDLLLIE